MLSRNCGTLESTYCRTPFAQDLRAGTTSARLQSSEQRPGRVKRAGTRRRQPEGTFSITPERNVPSGPRCGPRGSPPIKLCTSDWRISLCVNSSLIRKGECSPSSPKAHYLRTRTHTWLLQSTQYFLRYTNITHLQCAWRRQRKTQNRKHTQEPAMTQTQKCFTKHSFQRSTLQIDRFPPRGKVWSPHTDGHPNHTNRAGRRGRSEA